MARNIFDIAKDVVRELRDADWQFISPQEAAEELITDSTKYFNTDRPIHDTIDRRGFIAALAKEFDDCDQQPQKSTTQLPENIKIVEDIELVEDILFFAFASYNTHSPDTRSYSDFALFFDQEDRTACLIVADTAAFDFEKALQKIDFYKITAPRHFVEFTFDGETWVKDGLKDNDISSLNLFPVEQGYYLTPQGEIIPKEKSLIPYSVTLPQKIQTLLEFGEDIPLTEDEKNELNRHLEAQKEANLRKHERERADLIPEGSTWFCACKKETFLARMKELGIKLPEKDGPT